MKKLNLTELIGEFANAADLAKKAADKAAVARTKATEAQKVAATAKTKATEAREAYEHENAIPVGAGTKLDAPKLLELEDKAKEAEHATIAPEAEATQFNLVAEDEEEMAVAAQKKADDLDREIKTLEEAEKAAKAARGRTAPMPTIVPRAAAAPTAGPIITAPLVEDGPQAAAEPTPEEAARAAELEAARRQRDVQTQMVEPLPRRIPAEGGGRRVALPVAAEPVAERPARAGFPKWIVAALAFLVLFGGGWLLYHLGQGQTGTAMKPPVVSPTIETVVEEKVPDDKFVNVALYKWATLPDSVDPTFRRYIDRQDGSDQYVCSTRADFGTPTFDKKSGEAVLRIGGCKRLKVTPKS